MWFFRREYFLCGEKAVLSSKFGTKKEDKIQIMRTNEDRWNFETSILRQKKSLARSERSSESVIFIRLSYRYFPSTAQKSVDKMWTNPRFYGNKWYLLLFRNIPKKALKTSETLIYKALRLISLPLQLQQQLQR